MRRTGSLEKLERPCIPSVPLASVYPADKYSLSTYCVPGGVLSLGCSRKQSNQMPCVHGIYILMGEAENT